MAKEFIFSKIVYLAETNAFGNVYFSRYFDWQGMARESFFKKIAGDHQEMLTSGVKYITIKAENEYKKECFLFDELEIKVVPTNIRLTTVELIFVFRREKNDEIIAQGKQRIGFTNEKDEVIPIPENLLLGAKEYLNDADRESLKKLLEKHKK